jgi:lysozyme family protein
MNPAGNQQIDDGLIETSGQRQRVGFVDHPKDPGGVTKFGVAQKFNPQVDVKTSTYAAARQTAYNLYWLNTTRPCNTLTKQIAAFVFDCNYLFGVGGSKQIFDASGISGTETGGAAITAIDKLLEARYARIDTRSPDLLKEFGNGWRNRAAAAAAYAKSLP